MKKNKKTEEKTAGERRKEYSPPKLLKYGALRELTSGLTGAWGDPGGGGVGKRQK